MVKNNFAKKMQITVSVCENHDYISIDRIKNFPVSKTNNPFIDDYIKNVSNNEQIISPYICDVWDASFIVYNEHHLSRGDIKESIETIMQYLLQTYKQQLNAFPPEEMINIINSLMGGEFITAYKSEGAKKALGAEYAGDMQSPFNMIINFDDEPKETQFGD